MSNSILNKVYSNIIKLIYHYDITDYKQEKLAKKKEYSFRFDGKENFVGVYNPPKPKKKEEKK